MELPLSITFRDLQSSEAIEGKIRERADKLERFFDRITSCRVIVEAPHRRHQHGRVYHVRIHLTVPSGEIVVGRDPAENHAHEDVYVAIRDAFDAVERRLEDLARRRRGVVKSHEAPPPARVVRLFPEEDYGFLETADGREIYFHRNSVLNGGYDRLTVGTEVRFVEEPGEKGPQASTVAPMSRRATSA